MNKSTAVVLIIAVLAIGAIGFKMMSTNGTKKSTATTSPGTTTTLTIDGSNTMVHLVTKWSEAFMQAHPDVKITVNGQGSGIGISSLTQGTIDICSASRAMKPEEITAAKSKGFTPKEYSVALDGIAVVVNPGNTLNEVNFEQLMKVFTGESTDWKQIGGASLPIEVLSRESTSGTYEFFRERVMKKKDFTASAKVFPATPAIIQTTTDDTGAIGYVGLGYAVEAKGKVKVLNIKKDDKSPAVAPSEQSVVDGTYPISRSLFFYTRNEATGATKDFIDFCLSPAGQTIVKDAGFVKLAK